MGRFDFEISTDFLRKLGRLSDIERIAPKMIDETLPLCTDYLKNGIESAPHPYSKGDMVRSIKEKHASVGKDGVWFGITRPTGKDKDGTRNMEKLVYYEYGTSHQPARPIMDKIKNDASGPAKDKMEQVFKREMDV